MLCENTCSGFFYFSMAKKLTQEEFIEKAKEKHGNKYDYSKTKYVNARTPVTIICPIHGEFTQSACTHLLGHGCDKCGREKTIMSRKNNTEAFIEQLKEKFGDGYDYSEVVYIDQYTPVVITCKKHNYTFHGAPKELKERKTLCPKCSQNYSPTTDEFIERAKSVHGDKYDYSKTKYEKNNKEVCIICPEHGEFWQTPANHVNQKHGCKECGLIKMGKSHNKTTEQFIEKARLVHGDLYDYSNTVYTKRENNVNIICKIHGPFTQTAGNHLCGGGCKECLNSHLEEKIRVLLQNNKIKYEYEKRFEWLKNVGPMTIDFYLPEYNIAIECQGEQHYRPVKYFGGPGELVKDMKRDKVKEKLLLEHEITPIYFSAEKYRDDALTEVEEVLNKILEKK